MRAAGHDRLEREPLPAVLAKQLLEPPREVALRPPDEALLREGLEGGVRDRGSAADGVELTVVLDRAEPLKTEIPGAAQQCGQDLCPDSAFGFPAVRMSWVSSIAAAVVSTSSTIWSVRSDGLTDVISRSVPSSRSLK